MKKFGFAFKLASVIIYGIPGISLGEMKFNRSSVAEIGSQGHALADINGDGNVDVVVAEGEFSPKVFAWYKYPGWQKYDINNSALTQLDYPPDLQCADIDGDGDMDVVLPNSRNPGVGSGLKAVSWFANPKIKPGGAGSPETETWVMHPVWEGSDAHIKDVVVADMDKDGRRDILLRIEDKVRLFYQDGLDSWTQKTFAVSGQEGMDVGELDGDGLMDVVASGSWYRNPGTRTGTWTGRTVASEDRSQSRVIVADINGDAKNDVLLSASEGSGSMAVAWYSAANPETSPWTGHVIADNIPYCHTLQAGDMDKNGTMDVVAGQIRQATGAQLRVYLNGNSGSAWTAHSVGNFTSYIGKIADLGNDGDLDIVGSRSFDYGPMDFFENSLGSTSIKNRREGAPLPQLFRIGSNSRDVRLEIRASPPGNEWFGPRIEAFDALGSLLSENPGQ